MDPRKVKTAADARAIVEGRNLSHVKVGVFDVDGILRGSMGRAGSVRCAEKKGRGFKLAASKALAHQCVL